MILASKALGVISAFVSDTELLEESTPLRVEQIEQQRLFLKIGKFVRTAFTD